MHAVRFQRKFTLRPRLALLKGRNFSHCRECENIVYEAQLKKVRQDTFLSSNILFLILTDPPLNLLQGGDFQIYQEETLTLV